jgi:hypothetical protein
MDDLSELIAALDDTTAQRILAVVARQRVRSNQATEMPLTEEEANHLAGSGGELARQCLLLLATDPAQQPILRSLVTNPAAQKFADPVTLLVVGTAALVVLQTHVQITRNEKGKWAFELRRDAMSNPLLKALIEKVAGYFVGK